MSEDKLHALMSYAYDEGYLWAVSGGVQRQSYILFGLDFTAEWQLGYEHGMIDVVEVVYDGG